MADGELYNQIENLVEREAIAFCLRTVRHRTWRMAGTYLHCRAGHLFGVCKALKALQSRTVSNGERRFFQKVFQDDVLNAFGGDLELAERWMRMACADAARDQFRNTLIAWDVEWHLRSRPAGKRHKVHPAKPQPQTSPTLRVIQGGKKGGRDEKTRPAATTAAL